VHFNFKEPDSSKETMDTEFQNHVHIERHIHRGLNSISERVHETDTESDLGSFEGCPYNHANAKIRDTECVEIVVIQLDPSKI